MKSLLTTFFTILLVISHTGGHAQSGTHPTQPANPSAIPTKPTSPPPANTTKPNPTAPANANAKPDTSHAQPLHDPSTPEPDDEFNAFLLVIGLAFACIVLGATLVGAAAATLFLLLLFALASAGIISAGVLVGLYRRSLAAGFRTILILTCSISTMIGGAVCFWLINRIFHISLISSTALLIGAFSGLLGGILLGYVLTGIIRLFMNYCRQKLSF